MAASGTRTFEAAAATTESAAATPIAEADRMRTALLAAVSHDLRTPLAAARAAVSCLRATDIQLTAEDHDELLATADESLGQLSHLLASLLDVSRLQAGVLPVFPRPAILAEIIAAALGGVGPQATGGHCAHSARAAPGHGRSAALGTGHRERDRERAAVLPERIAAAADRQRPRRQGHPARRRLRARASPRPTGTGSSRPSSGSAMTGAPSASGWGSRCPAAWPKRCDGTLQPEDTSAAA